MLRINRKKDVGTYIWKSRLDFLRIPPRLSTWRSRGICLEVSKSLGKYWQFTKIWSWSRPLKSTILKTLIPLLSLDLIVFVETSQPIKNISPLGFCATKVHARGPCYFFLGQIMHSRENNKPLFLLRVERRVR